MVFRTFLDIAPKHCLNVRHPCPDVLFVAQSDESLALHQRRVVSSFDADNTNRYLSEGRQKGRSDALTSSLKSDKYHSISTLPAIRCKRIG
jgi:hypothetical protein